MACALLVSCSGGGGTYSAPPAPPPPASIIQSFSASPATITAGQSSTLSWTLSGATSFSLSGVTATPANSITVTPAATTTYTLTAIGPSGTFMQPVTVEVTSATPIGSAQVSTLQPGTAISPTFLGFSHEWTGAPTLMGSPATGTNPIYRQLVKNLLAYGGGPLIVRIGGNSTDETGAPVAGVVAPEAQLATDIGAKFTLGVNLGSDNVQLATNQAAAYIPAMPSGSLLAIEIGNEPDLYAGNGDRAATYTVANYFQDFATWRAAIEPLLPAGAGLMGPSWASTSTLTNLSTFLSQESQYLAIVSQHYYAGTSCSGKTNPPDFLLGASESTSGPKDVASYVPLAHADNLPFRMGEMNSISCGGETGVSDTFASALWSADIMFGFASVGVDGVNFHNGNGGAYALFQFNINTATTPYTYSIESIRPEYYGLLFFQQATAHGSKLLPGTLTTAANLKVWATLDDTGNVRVALINKDETATGVVTITLSGYGNATVTRLLAPTYQSTSGITLGGQTFDGSTDGTAQGTAYGEIVAPQNGIYTVAIGPTSAALVTVSP
ncbi:MAG: glycosyl hydrolase family 79 C-terminal domain-containing protein [Candidatus Acidiferrales bacterium]